MKRKGIDNFKQWRERMKLEGKIKSRYDPLKRNEDLAELIGVVLGDGHICRFVRTESLRIVGNANNPNFAKYYAHIIEKVFDKKPYVVKRKTSEAFDITIYEKYISKRLNIPTGSRRDKKFLVPRWILSNKNYIIQYLRGLYEAEGSISFHKKTYTHKMIFSNKNNSLLNNVYYLVKQLGFHPHRSGFKIQISKKQEVQEFKNLLHFRHYRK